MTPGSQSWTTPASTTGSSRSFSTGSRPETELSSGWEPSLESDTLRMLQESGSGLTGTRPSNGLTGPKVSLTTTTDSIAWLLWNGTRILSTSTGTTFGTTSTAT